MSAYEVSREEARSLAGHPGGYEGLTPFEVWLWENGGYDQSWWDDEASSGDGGDGSWLARIGRRLLFQDSMGFRYVTRETSEEAARATFLVRARKIDDDEEVEL